MLGYFIPDSVIYALVTLGTVLNAELLPVWSIAAWNTITIYLGRSTPLVVANGHVNIVAAGTAIELVLLFKNATSTNSELLPTISNIACSCDELGLTTGIIHLNVVKFIVASLTDCDNTGNAPLAASAAATLVNALVLVVLIIRILCFNPHITLV